MVWDEPMTLTYDDKEWSPKNYEDEYDGYITLRRALALSRNSATIRVAEQTGFDRVASFWRRMKIGTVQPRGVPAIALGVYELTPLELATAYTVFPGGGAVHPLRAIASVVSGEKTLQPPAKKRLEVADPAAAFLVTHMMRSVLNEGTGAGARARGFALDAAGKTGTTNDLRDAWFVGFTPELLTVVWVGLDGNQPLGLSGTQAALPIWTAFMMKALAGHPNVEFDAPDEVTFVLIDRDTGKLAGPYCPRTISEAFTIGSEPTEACPLHR
jgi:penicillin-binding protein 1B